MRDYLAAIFHLTQAILCVFYARLIFLLSFLHPSFHTRNLPWQNAEGRSCCHPATQAFSTRLRCASHQTLETQPARPCARVHESILGAAGRGYVFLGTGTPNRSEWPPTRFLPDQWRHVYLLSFFTASVHHGKRQETLLSQLSYIQLLPFRAQSQFVTDSHPNVKEIIPRVTVLTHLLSSGTCTEFLWHLIGTSCRYLSYSKVTFHLRGIVSEQLQMVQTKHWFHWIQHFSPVTTYFKWPKDRRKTQYLD